MWAEVCSTSRIPYSGHHPFNLPCLLHFLMESTCHSSLSQASTTALLPQWNRSLSFNQQRSDFSKCKSYHRVMLLLHTGRRAASLERLSLSGGPNQTHLNGKCFHALTQEWLKAHRTSSCLQNHKAWRNNEQNCSHTKNGAVLWPHIGSGGLPA